jgi:hypothetical protein
MTTFIQILDYLIMLSIAVFALMQSVNTEDTENFRARTFLGFGFMIATNPKFISTLTYVRRDANAGFNHADGRLYIKAPQYFNKYVYNFGPRKRLPKLAKLYT